MCKDEFVGWLRSNTNPLTVLNPEMEKVLRRIERLASVGALAPPALGAGTVPQAPFLSGVVSK
jgi:hypothetical protein